MPGRPYSKAQRRILRELAGLAYKRELASELGELEAHFKAWREGQIGPFALNDRIHEFHNGASRDLWKTYVNLHAEMVVPMAVARGVIQESEVPRDLLESMRLIIDSLRSLRESDTPGPSGAEPTPET